MEGKSILLVEDNPKIMRNNIAELTSRGAFVLSAETLAEARRIAAERAFDTAALDIMLPDGSGLALLREIRKTSNVPILILTALGESGDVVEGLTLGADDYLVKPYDMDVLAARLESLLRRSWTVSEGIIFGPLRFDLISAQAFYKGEDLLLTQKEFALLLLMTQNEKKILSAEYLYEKSWGRPLSGDIFALKKRVSELKKKLAIAPEIVVETSYREGYILTILQ